MTDRVEIFSDGACRGNPGPGGWGALLHFKGKQKEIYGGERETTNNRMELLAVIEALGTLRRPCQVHIMTDSQYVMKGITEWIKGWKRRNWKNSANKPVKNADLWMRLDEAVSGHDVRWSWVRGHTGHPGNERADALANRGIDEMLKG